LVSGATSALMGGSGSEGLLMGLASSLGQTVAAKINAIIQTELVAGRISAETAAAGRALSLSLGAAIKIAASGDSTNPLTTWANAFMQHAFTELGVGQPAPKSLGGTVSEGLSGLSTSPQIFNELGIGQPSTAPVALDAERPLPTPSLPDSSLGSGTYGYGDAPMLSPTEIVDFNPLVSAPWVAPTPEHIRFDPSISLGNNNDTTTSSVNLYQERPAQVALKIPPAVTLTQYPRADLDVEPDFQTSPQTAGESIKPLASAIRDTTTLPVNQLTPEELQAERMRVVNFSLQRNQQQATHPGGSGVLPEEDMGDYMGPSRSAPRTVRAGDYRGSLERVARDQLGPNATQREINNYVGQLFEVNGITNARTIGGDRTIQLPDADTAAATVGLGRYGRDIAIGEQINANRIAQQQAQTYRDTLSDASQALTNFTAGQGGGAASRGASPSAPAMREEAVYTAMGDYAGTKMVPVDSRPVMSYGQQMSNVWHALTDAPIGTVQQIIQNPGQSAEYAKQGVIGLVKGVPNFVTETLTQTAIGVRYLAAAGTDATGLTTGQLSREIEQYRDFSGTLFEYDNTSQHVAGFVSGFATPAMGAKVVAGAADTLSAVRTATGASEGWAAAHAERAALLSDARLSEEVIAKIQSIPKGMRPDPRAYMEASVIEGQLMSFEQGASRFMTQSNLQKYGIAQRDGTAFVMPAREADALLVSAGGDMRAMESSLDLPDKFLDSNALMRIDIPRPRELNLRPPSGNEAGAIDGLWIPGGRLPNGNLEAVIDAGGLAASRYAATPVRVGSPGVSDAVLPLGSKRLQFNQPKNPVYQPVRNEPATVGGRDYSGHALDRMQDRGLMPSVVHNAIETGIPTPSRGGTIIHYDSLNNISVVTNSKGKVVTVKYGQ
jgi:hypothetical protein